jgi:hypothetical protein
VAYAIPTIPILLDSLNTYLWKLNIKVTLKPLQHWASNSKKMLCTVQSGLCTKEIKQLLLHRLKEMERKLCHHYTLNTLEWYDKSLYKMIVSLQTLRELWPPEDPKECEQHTFDPFPYISKFVYFLEASDAAWVCLDPFFN